MQKLIKQFKANLQIVVQCSQKGMVSTMVFLFLLAWRQSHSRRTIMRSEAGVSTQ